MNPYEIERCIRALEEKVNNMEIDIGEIKTIVDKLSKQSVKIKKNEINPKTG